MIFLSYSTTHTVGNNHQRHPLLQMSNQPIRARELDNTTKTMDTIPILQDIKTK